jgi:DNA-binding MarR family transcriptional regulator
MDEQESNRAHPGPPFGAAGPPLGFLLASVGFAAAFRFRSLIEPAGLGPREFAVLRQVASDEGVSQQACGAALKVAPSRMVALVDDLEAKGFLQRRSNPEDRRARALHVTAKGRRALAKAFESVVRNETEIYAVLSDAEKAELRRLLQIVADQLGLQPGEHPGMHVD